MFKKIKFYIKKYSNKVKNFVKQKFLYKNRIIIILGTYKVHITIISGKKIISTQYNGYKTIAQQSCAMYKNILKKYPKYHVTIILDSKNIKLQHVSIPHLQSALNDDPIATHIEQYDSDNLISYKIYEEITDDSNIIYNTILAIAPYENEVKDIVENTIIDRKSRININFLAFSLSTAIDNLLTKNIQYSQHINDVRILVFITQFGDIKIILKHKKNIINYITIPYPKGKSIEYIEGHIEQEIQDQIIIFKDQIIDENKVIICLSHNKYTKKLFENIIIKDCKTIIIETENDDVLNQTKLPKLYQDNVITSIIKDIDTDLASNKALKSFAKLSKISKFLFIPLMIFITSLTINILQTHYEIFSINTQIKNINKENNQIAQKYSELHDTLNMHNNINNIYDIIALYNLQKIFNSTKPDLLNHAKCSLQNHNQAININKLQATISYKPDVTYIDHRLYILLKLSCNDSKNDNKCKILINHYIENLKTTNQDKTLLYEHNVNNSFNSKLLNTKIEIK